MKKIYCVNCKKKHTSFNWRLIYESDKKKYGWYCDLYFKPTNPEFVPESLRTSRNKYAKSLLQPYREGVASREYIDSYGGARFSPKDIANAKNVWGDVLPNNWKKSK